MKAQVISCRDLLKTCILGGALVIAAAGLSVRLLADENVQTPVFDIADRNQVFIDGRYLHEKHNVRIVVCPPTKTNKKSSSDRA